MSSIAELRKYQYNYHCGNYPEVNSFIRYPYTWLKARFYMEASAVLVYFLLKTRIKPNTITLFYAFCGVVGGILLSIPTNTTILLALFIFFTKGILDWSDGHYARVIKQTSFTGAVLDPYGALVNSLGFWIGLSFFMAHLSQDQIYLYLAPVYPALLAAGVLAFGNNFIIGTILRDGPAKLGLLAGQKKAVINERSSATRPWHARSRAFFMDLIARGFPDDRARTVDLICLFIILVMFTQLDLAWAIYLIYFVFIAKKGLSFLYGLFLVYKKGWIENTASQLIDKVNNNANEVKK